MIQKQIDEHLFLTEEEAFKFRFSNRGKEVKGPYDRLFMDCKNLTEKKNADIDAAIARNAKGIWKETKRVPQKGIEKKHRPFIVGSTARRKI